MASYIDSMRERTDAELVHLMLARPDLAVPRPGSLLSLAARATNRASLERALAGLDAFTLQVLETIVALTPVPGERVDAARVTAAITGAPRVAVDAAVLHELDLALIWPDASAPTTTSTPPDGGRRTSRTTRATPVLVPAPGLAELLGPYPAGLGPLTDPASSAHVLRRIRAANAAAADSAEGASSTAGTAVPDLADAPPGATAILDALTWGPPAGRAPTSGPGAEATAWLVERGLLLRPEAGLVLLPREVGLALRHGHAFAASAHAAPAPDAQTYDPESVDAESLTAVDAVTHQVAELLALWTQNPPTPLRSGGLSVRDLRRLAAHLGTDEAAAAFTVELAAAAGLVMDDAELSPHLAPTAVAEH
ncbi:MAG: helicase-associated domain-containing protein, partial [Cellulomonadaceae bacterium]